MASKLEVFMATALSVWSKTTYQYVCHTILGNVTNFDAILKTHSREMDRKQNGGSDSVSPSPDRVKGNIIYAYNDFRLVIMNILIASRFP